MFAQNPNDVISLLAEYNRNLFVRDDFCRQIIKERKFPKTEQMRKIFDDCARWLADNNKFEDVKVIFRQCYEIWPDDRTKYNYGIVLLETGKYDQACSVLHDIKVNNILIWDNSSKILLKRAICLWNFQKHRKEAFRLLDLAQQLSPNDMEIAKAILALSEQSKQYNPNLSNNPSH